MSTKDEKKQEITAETSLAPQFGSDTRIIAQGEFDQMIMANIDEAVIVPVAYFLAKPKHKGGNFCKNFFGNYLKLSRAKNGWNSNKMIQETQASKGVASGVGEIVKKPNIVQRNVFDRKWRDRAEEKGATVVE